MEITTVYEPGDQVLKDIDNRFSYHAPHGDQVARYARIRRIFHDAAMDLVILCPRSRELSEALSFLQHASMKANAAIACNEPEQGPVNEEGAGS